jgi:hypothetical protein
MLAVAMLSLSAGGVWAGLALASAMTTKAGDCCLDPTCPPGCSEVCPPNCPFPDCCTGAKGVKAAGKKAVAKTVDCCDDPTRPPGGSPACPPDCLDLTAKASTKTAAKSSCCSDGECCPTATKTSVAKKYICPPCPFCPGW